MAEMSISEVARRVGVRTSALRYYESIGLLPPPVRVSGRRRYDASVLQRLEIIRTAQQAGFTLEETRILFDDILESDSPVAKWHALIGRKLHELSVLMANAQNMKTLLEEIRDCDGAELEECIYLTGQKHRAGA